jgi:hypothetical protein
MGAACTVRTLNMLTQTLQHLQRLRASVALSEKPIARNDHDADDDMPRDRGTANPNAVRLGRAGQSAALAS